MPEFQIEKSPLDVREKLAITMIIFVSVVMVVLYYFNSQDIQKNRDNISALEVKIDGDKGPTGNKGPLGGEGLRGRAGLRGKRGSQGPRGFKGAKGNRGQRGLRGSRGFKGNRGQVGPRGPQGRRGPPGVVGPEGQIGETPTAAIEQLQQQIAVLQQQICSLRALLNIPC